MYINSWPKPDRPSEVSVYRGADCFLLLMITSLCDARELRRPRPSLPLRKKTELLNIRAQHSSNHITYQIRSHLLSHLSLSWENIHHKYDYINVSTHAKRMQVAATHFFLKHALMNNLKIKCKPRSWSSKVLVQHTSPLQIILSRSSEIDTL